MGRRCSRCGNNGHNSRTCTSSRNMVGVGELRLFGVQIQLASTSTRNKSFSLDCLCPSGYSASASSSSSSSSSSIFCIDEGVEKFSNGYLSDGLLVRVQEKRKGVPWSEEEHRAFLAGLEKLGKGDWCGISRNFVITRTPTQVASHAQKYFLRQNSPVKKKRRSSLFDEVGGCQRPHHASDSSNIKDPSFVIDLNISEQEPSSPPHDSLDSKLIPNS
ncbi:transcription factor MYBS3-like [Phalaenopsis equestris]|uniref:transcription factor MYBS3-like n=1 Tax=Phalaenopsis equestris TaxID=78828 RepID=UPI0009E2C2ED|nr:transcription factor MYBS3-like [Phalaenopsis equestris]